MIEDSEALEPKFLIIPKMTVGIDTLENEIGHFAYDIADNKLKVVTVKSTTGIVVTST